MPVPLQYFNQAYLPKTQTNPATVANLPQAASPNYNPAYGGIPNVPNPVATAGQAVAGNQANLPSISNLATSTGTLSARLGQLPYNANLPNYQALLGQASSNALSNLSGVLPSGVTNQISQAAAERGIATGSPGSPNSNAALLSALGLNSLQLQNQGLSQFGSLMGMTPTGPQFNPSSFYVDPNSQQQAQAAANLYGAAPIPAYAQGAAMNALNQGLNRGQNATAPAPTQSQDVVGQILNRYSPTAIGTPSPGLPQGTTDTSGVVSSAGVDTTGFDPTDPLAGFYDTGTTDTSNYYPDFAPAVDLSDPNAFDFTGDFSGG